MIDDKLKTTVTIAIAAALPAACSGPSAQQRRACEFYKDAGGQGPESETVAHWMKFHEQHPKDPGYKELYDRIRIQLHQPIPTPEQEAENDRAEAVVKNLAARDTVASRLTMTQREVTEALALCQKEKK